MTPYELKQYIVDNNKVQFLLEKMGCHGFKEHNKDYRCGLPNDPTTTKISVYKDTLKTKVYGTDISGDIFTLCMSIYNISFVQANKKIHELLGLKYSWKKEKKKDDPLDIFKKAKSASKMYVNDVEIYDESILLDFMPYPHINWVREGIMPYTCERFGIGYSPRHKRIIIPHRYWCGEENDYLGIFGRTVIEAYEMLDIPKYLGIKPYSKSLNLYGAQENYEYIQKAGYVVVGESEKNVLKRDSLLDRTVVAICCNSISPEQVRILIGLDVEIILAFDKGITEEHTRNECKKLSRARRVSYIWDEYDILEDKESPMDKENKLYEFLLKTRKSFN